MGSQKESCWLTYRSVRKRLDFPMCVTTLTWFNRVCKQNVRTECFFSKILSDVKRFAFAPSWSCQVKGLSIAAPWKDSHSSHHWGELILLTWTCWGWPQLRLSAVAGWTCWWGPQRWHCEWRRSGCVYDRFWLPVSGTMGVLGSRLCALFQLPVRAGTIRDVSIKNIYRMLNN